MQSNPEKKDKAACREARRRAAQEKTLEEQLFLPGLLLVPAGIVLLLFFDRLLPFLPPYLRGCVWDRFFHIYCLGCGGTRSLKALLHGNFLLSLWYYPAILPGAVFYICFLGSQVLYRLTGARFPYLKLKRRYLFVLAGLVIVNCIVKNILRLVFGIAL